jgi:hypothetical protein
MKKCFQSSDNPVEIIGLWICVKHLLSDVNKYDFYPHGMHLSYAHLEIWLHLCLRVAPR